MRMFSLLAQFEVLVHRTSRVNGASQWSMGQWLVGWCVVLGESKESKENSTDNVGEASSARGIEFDQQEEHHNQRQQKQQQLSNQPQRNRHRLRRGGKPLESKQGGFADSNSARHSLATNQGPPSHKLTSMTGGTDLPWLVLSSPRACLPFDPCAKPGCTWLSHPFVNAPDCGRAHRKA
jgi:hypothetical protein